MTTSTRESELADAQARAARAAARTVRLAPADHVVPTPARMFTQVIVAAAGDDGSPTVPRPVPLALGTVMSELLRHGGFYTLNDPEMTRRRLSGMLQGMETAKAPAGMAEELAAAALAAQQVPNFFFYHLVRNPYKLHSQLVSYLVHPARHLGSPAIKAFAPPLSADSYPAHPPCVAPEAESLRPHEAPGKTYSQCNTPSPKVPAAATFIGQFVDHDLTLNALNLLSPQSDPAIRDMASPLIDLDSVYGPRLDDAAKKIRLVPMKGGKFRLNRIGTSDCYDVCREKDKDTGAMKALIGDKRNDENQLILQVHIAAIRLHNHFMGLQTSGTLKQKFAAAKKQTLLHWQAMIATYYLPLVARPKAIAEVKKRLFDLSRKNPKAKPLCHRPGLTACGGTTLGMPHEFAIGFRFGHSQLRSEYVLKDKGEPIRLFDPLQVSPASDLTGDKPLALNHCINWEYFTNPAEASSNVIDTKVNEVVFSLPESTIPDDVRLVTNLPLRNLIRSNDLGLCSGEDLARCYHECYGDLAKPLTADEVEDPTKGGRQAPFMLEPDPSRHPRKKAFRTPLWYYLLREAERHAEETGDPLRRLGMVGSLLVAEVILSGIFYARLFVPDDPDGDGDGTPAPPPVCASAAREEEPICSIFTDPSWSNEFGAWNPDGDGKPGDGPICSFLDLVKLGRVSTAPECEKATS